MISKLSQGIKLILVIINDYEETGDISFVPYGIYVYIYV